MAKTPLLADLLQKPQRETAGSDTNLRFDYQKSWAFCRMIRDHLDGVDYLVAFEFHDDVVFLKPSENPDHVEFCQVKTSKAKEGRTLGSFLSQATKEKASIIGKMYSNFDGICSSQKIDVVLVSNVPFKFGDTKFCAKDLEEKYKTQLIEKLTKEIPSFDVARLENIHFLDTEVSLEAMRSFLLGEVTELLKAELGEANGVNAHAWTRGVQDEINRKNNFASDKVTNIEELIGRKCIDRSFMTTSIKMAANNKPRAPDMQLVNAELLAIGWKSKELMMLGKQIPKAVSDFTDPSNVEAATLRERLEAIYLEKNPDSLSEFLSLALENKDVVTNGLAPYSDESYFSAFAVVVFHEAI